MKWMSVAMLAVCLGCAASKVGPAHRPDGFEMSEAEIWARLKGKDYVDDSAGFAGMGLRFFEGKDGGRFCLVVRLGSGVPVIGSAEEPVALKGQVVRVGDGVTYEVDPATLALSRKGGEPFFPDGVVLRRMLELAKRP